MFSSNSPPHSHEVENFLVAVLPIVLRGRSPVALNHGQFAPGKGKDLNSELPIQLQRACIHLYG